MPRPTMRRRPKGAQKAFEGIPAYVPSASDMRFLVPPV